MKVLCFIIYCDPVHRVQNTDDEDLQSFWYLDPLLCFGLVQVMGIKT